MNLRCASLFLFLVAELHAMDGATQPIRSPKRKFDSLKIATDMAHIIQAKKCLPLVKYIESLITSRANLNQPQPPHDKPILFELLHDEANIPLIEELIEQGADPNTYWSHRRPLYVALKDNQLAIVEALLRKGANPELAIDLRNNALHLAMDDGFGFCNLDAVKLLLHKGANPNARDTFDQHTPLMKITRLRDQFGYTLTDKERKELITLFLEAGANINLPTENGKPMVDWLADYEGKEFAEFIRQEYKRITIQKLAPHFAVTE